MRIFIATAKLDDIRWAHSHGLIDGVLTTPSLLTAQVHPAGANELLADICGVASFPVAATVGAVHAADIYRDARELAKLSDSMIVQVPFVEDAISSMRRLRSEGVRVAATLVFNAAQALLAAKAGAQSVVTPIDHLDAVGQGGVQVVRELRAVFDASATECALAGAAAIAVRPDVLRRLLLHPLTDRGLDQLLRDLSQQHRQWTPA